MYGVFDASLGEGADDGMAPPGIAGQFGLKQCRQEEGVSGQFRDAHVAPLHLLDAGPLTTTAIAEGPVVITMANAHPLAGRDRLSLEDLVDARWIDAPDTATPLIQLRTIARADGLHASLRYDGTDVHALLALVSAGGGLALLPQPVVQGRPDLAGVPLAAPRVVHRTELVHGSLAGPPEELAIALKHR